MPESNFPYSPVQSYASSAEPRNPAPVASPAGGTRIGPDLSIVGNIEAKGEIHFDGQIEGDISAGTLIVGSGASITGNISADTVFVRGKVNGTLRSNEISLLQGSSVNGDVYHKQLSIEAGAFFEGRSRRSDNPLEQKDEQRSPIALRHSSAD